MNTVLVDSLRLRIVRNPKNSWNSWKNLTLDCNTQLTNNNSDAGAPPRSNKKRGSRGDLRSIDYQGWMLVLQVVVCPPWLLFSNALLDNHTSLSYNAMKYVNPESRRVRLRHHPPRNLLSQGALGQKGAQLQGAPGYVTFHASLRAGTVHLPLMSH